MRKKYGERDRGNSSLQRNRGVKKASLFQGERLVYLGHLNLGEVSRDVCGKVDWGGILKGAIFHTKKFGL